ncbi:UDP-glycosyltransferase 73C6-like [Hordeum vulgare subsp. vulgare]|uniref:Glycosyltransferase n=1 Tax=Hordeum vulgare subsp. vulgare TaxID=112509 RepID=D3WYW4_HORVV|nr:UDP-glycosyltransferase 73C6-like [Hordeum vulgare subsp. vulgare]ADC92552.1 UDP-glucosyltransferase HvUGT19290 [Hordeum vulgare subsp. vulgare]
METPTKPHFVLVPWIGSISHIVSMTDIGCLLASHGASVAIITTPANASLVQSRVDRVTPRGAVIAVTAIPFPAAEAGLPEECERLDLTTSPAMVPAFFQANKKFGEAVAHYCLQDAPRRPSCIVAGMCHTWTLPVARDLGVPCYIFHGFGAFALLCIDHLYRQGRHEAIASADEVVDISVLPPFECKILGRQLTPHFLPSMSMGSGLMQEVREFDMAVDGVVVNSFDELEHGSAALLAAAAGKKVLAVGPVSLCCAPSLDPESDDARRCMSWLDGKKAESVVYVSFGSAGCIPPAQLMQLGMALVSCRWPVMWVIRGADSLPDDVKAWLRENTDGDCDSKCLVVRGWAPQVAILAHPAVGGFMTHCGWGSTLESVAAGVPMVTWPLFAEQFVNEKLIVDVLGVGVSVGVRKPTANVLTAGKPGSGEAKAEVGAEQVKSALEKLMGGGVEGEDMRRKALACKAKANASLKEGGSSYKNLEELIQSCV